MRILAILILLVCVAGCGSAANKADSSLQLAKPAERNLTRLRDAVVKHYAATGAAPESVTELEGFIGGLEPGEDYTDLGYTFYSLAFDEERKLARGWFLATPRVGSEAPQVRMNGVTGKFEHLPRGQAWAPAADDS